MDTTCIGHKQTCYKTASTSCELASRGIHYRILYFFHGNVAAVVSHGLTKERAVPPREIELAIKRRARFLANPTKHTFEDK